MQQTRLNLQIGATNCSSQNHAFCFRNNTVRQFIDRQKSSAGQLPLPWRPDSAPARGVRMVTRLNRASIAPSCSCCLLTVTLTLDQSSPATSPQTHVNIPHQRVKAPAQTTPGAHCDKERAWAAKYSCNNSDKPQLLPNKNILPNLSVLQRKMLGFLPLTPACFLGDRSAWHTWSFRRMQCNLIHQESSYYASSSLILFRASTTYRYFSKPECNCWCHALSHSKHRRHHIGTRDVLGEKNLNEGRSSATIRLSIYSRKEETGRVQKGRRKKGHSLEHRLVKILHHSELFSTAGQNTYNLRPQKH